MSFDLVQVSVAGQQNCKQSDFAEKIKVGKHKSESWRNNKCILAIKKLKIGQNTSGAYYFLQNDY